MKTANSGLGISVCPVVRLRHEKMHTSAYQRTSNYENYSRIGSLNFMGTVYTETFTHVFKFELQQQRGTKSGIGPALT
jgi:hypothetical protein